MNSITKIQQQFLKEGSKISLAANCTYYRAIRAMLNCVQSGKYGEVIFVEMDNGAVINYSGCTGVGSMSK